MELKPNPSLWIFQLVMALILCLSGPAFILYAIITDSASVKPDSIPELIIFCLLCLLCLPLFIGYILWQYKIRFTEEGIFVPVIRGSRLLRWAEVEKAVLSSWRGRVFLLLCPKSGKSVSVALDAYEEADKLLEMIKVWLPVPVQDDYGVADRLKGS